MAKYAGVGDFLALRLRRGDEFERMASYVYNIDCLLNLWHMTGGAFAARAVDLMVRVRFDRAAARPVGGVLAMALQAERIARLDGAGGIFRAVNIVAVKTFYAAIVHYALDEIVALHAILMAGSIGEVRERRFS